MKPSMTPTTTPSTKPLYTPAMPCFWCKMATNFDGHCLTKCPAIVKVHPTRIALVLRAESWCTKCFEKCVYVGPTPHLSRTCTAKRFCTVCKSANHHGLLHGAERTCQKSWKAARHEENPFSFVNLFSIYVLVFVFFSYLCFRLSNVSRRARCAARRRVVEIAFMFGCGRRALKRKFWIRIDGNVEPKRAVSKPLPSNKDVRSVPLIF